MSRRRSARVFVGNLPEDIKKREIDDIFYKYGRIRDIDIKFPRERDQPAFAFLEFDDERDAEDAIRGRDGYKFDGERLRVEFPKSDRRAPPGRGRGGGPPGRGGPDQRGGNPPRRGEYSLQVTGLPEDTSWQDLKDHFRKAGQSDRDTGRVEFENKDDYENALETLDNSELVNRHKDRSTIRVFPDKGDKHGGEEKRPRSRSRSRSRSKDRKSRSRSRSKDRDDAPREDDRERDRSRSR